MNFFVNASISTSTNSLEEIVFISIINNSSFLDPATYKSNVEFSNCSKVGLITYSPSIFPTLTPQTDFLIGKFEVYKAAFAAFKAKVCKSTFYQQFNTITVIVVG